MSLAYLLDGLKAEREQGITIDVAPFIAATLQMIRYRSLGCHYCTGAIRSSATTLTQIVEEMMTVRTSERGTRIIDHDREGSMEEKKMEGYF